MPAVKYLQPSGYVLDKITKKGAVRPFFCQNKFVII
jgi:hypothetical protein